MLLHFAVSWSARSVVIVKGCGGCEILRGLRAAGAVGSVAALYEVSSGCCAIGLPLKGTGIGSVGVEKSNWIEGRCKEEQLNGG